MKFPKLFFLVFLLCGSVQKAHSEFAFDHRLKQEKEQISNKWAITAHRPTYFLPLTYAPNPKESPAKQINPNAELDEVEIKFQISFKMLALRQMFWNRGDLYIAYTQKSFWQAYNADESAPFRENNYEPEVFIAFQTNRDVYGLRNRGILLGFNHQSNGRGLDNLSKSWNRLYAGFILEKGNFLFLVKPWWRIPEATKDDDNPNIEKYVGYGDFRAIYKWKTNVFSLLLRNNLRADNKGAIELGWSFPLVQQLRGYVQFFNGYAENLLEFNRPNERIGIGILFADWI